MSRDEIKSQYYVYKKKVVMKISTVLQLNVNLKKKDNSNNTVWTEDRDMRVYDYLDRNDVTKVWVVLISLTHVKSYPELLSWSHVYSVEIRFRGECSTSPSVGLGWTASLY